VSFAFVDASARIWCDGVSGPDQQFGECEDEFVVFVGWNYCGRDVQQGEM